MVWKSEFVFCRSKLLNHFVVLCISFTLLCCVAFIYCHRQCWVGSACFFLFLCLLLFACNEPCPNANHDQVMSRSMHTWCYFSGQTLKWFSQSLSVFWTLSCSQKQTTDCRIIASTGRKKFFCWRKSKKVLRSLHHHSWVRKVMTHTGLDHDCEW